MLSQRSWKLQTLKIRQNIVLPTLSYWHNIGDVVSLSVSAQYGMYQTRKPNVVIFMKFSSLAVTKVLTLTRKWPHFSSVFMNVTGSSPPLAAVLIDHPRYMAGPAQISGTRWYTAARQFRSICPDSRHSPAIDVVDTWQIIGQGNLYTICSQPHWQKDW